MTGETERATNSDGRQAAGAEHGASKDSESFDSLLAEFEDKTGDKSQTVDRSAAVLKALKPVIDYVQDDRVEKQQTALDKDLGDAIDFVAQGEGLDKLPKPVLRGLMEARAAEDNAFAQAFQNRGAAPAEWQAQLEKGRDWAQEQMKNLIPKGAKNRDDLEAATAAVAGTETAAATSDDDDLPSSTSMFAMSDTAWQNFMAEQRGKAGN